MYPRIFDSLSSPTLSIRPTRRGFMLGAVASGLALTVGFRWIPGAQAQETPASHPVNPYISIAADGKVTIYSSAMSPPMATSPGAVLPRAPAARPR
jgi:hypothetical protein